MSRTMHRLLAVLAVTAGVAGCGDKGTFVVVTFTNGDASLAVKSLRCDLSLAGSTSMPQVRYTASGDKFSFPTKASIEVDKGEGALTARCDALDAADAVLASGDGMTSVVHGQTTQLTIALGAPPVGQDGGIQDGGTQDGGMGAIAIAPMIHAFGTKIVGEKTAAFAFTVTNTGSATTGALNATITGQDMADFTIDAGSTCTGKQLNGGTDSCTILVAFAPQSAGLVKNAKLRVAAPAGTPGGFATADLGGSAGAKGALSFSETMHDFGGQPLQTQGNEVSFTLTNTGGSSTTAITTSLDGANKSSWMISSDGCTGQVLQANGSCVIKLRLNPMDRGALTATLSATATTGGTATVDLTGTGKAPAQLVIVGGATMAARANLGTVDVGQTGTMAHMFTLRNDGDFDTGALSIISAMNSQITPTANTTCTQGMVLTPGATCVGEVVLRPSTFGTKNEDLSFMASPGGTVSTYVTGIGRDQVTINVANAAGQDADGTITDTATPHNFVCGQGSTTCSKVFTRTTTGFSVAFMAQPDTANFWLFSQWAMDPSLPCAGNDPTNSTCSFNLDATVAPGTYSYTANYKKRKFNLTYTRKDYGPPPLGQLSSMNGGISCNGPCTNTASPLQIDGGTTITVTASEDGSTSGVSAVRAISGACTGRSASTADATCTFVMNADKDVQILYSAFNFAFVSSIAYDGNLGGIGANVPPTAPTGAAAACQQLADAANLPGVFVALLSDGSTDAKSLLPATGGWIRPDGAPFARNRDALFGTAAPNYGVYYPLRVDEKGFLRSGDIVRTFSKVDGTHKTSGDHCSNWTSNSSALSTSPYARSSGGAIGWIDIGGIGFNCSSQERLYCFGTTQTANAPDPMTPNGANAKLVFLTKGLFTPGVGKTRDTIDALCATEGSVFAGKTFKSIAATSTSNMASQAGMPSMPLYVRPDKVVVGDFNQLFGASPNPQAAIDVYPDNTYLQPGTTSWVWTGAAGPTGLPTVTNDDCGDWANSALSGGRVGNAWESSFDLYTFSGSIGCSNASHAYCVEQ